MRRITAAQGALIIGAMTVLAASVFSQPLNRKEARDIPGQSKDEIIGRDGAPMILVEAGEFVMGKDQVRLVEPLATILRDLSYYESLEDQEPQRKIYLDAFYMDTYEVTASRYAKFLESSGRKNPQHWAEVDLSRHGDRPVIGVDWHDANAYCRWARKRLPSEAEWEKAARGTDGRSYPWGNQTPSRSFARYYQGEEDEDWKGYGMLSPVGSYAFGRSPFGFYDMAGNVAEWVADYYDKNYYKTGPAKNPKGPKTASQRVVRGGSWDGPARPIYFRGYAKRERRRSDLGFRCALDGAK
jgi:formylglycine-generating enzyme required for sulfatase activity